MQLTINNQIDYKQPSDYGKSYADALDEFTMLRLAGHTVKLCKVIGTEFYTTALYSTNFIEKNLKQFKIIA